MRSSSSSSSSSSSVVVVLVSLLVLSLHFRGAQGIRFKKGLFSPLAQENEMIHEERKSSVLKTSDGIVAEVVLCKEARNCNTGMNRKLISTTATTTSTSTSTIGSTNDEHNTVENHAKSNNPTSESKSSDGKSYGEQIEKSHNSSQDLHVDITDIAEMDYSPARRKPPIHN